MLISIVTPLYNSSEFIAKAIESVQKQSCQNWEMLIVDDASIDNSIQIVENYIQNDNRIILIKQKKNRGAAIARNKGIEIAKGKYIAFLDSDDTWHVDKLKIQINAMESNNLNFTFTNYYLTDEKKRDVVSFNSLLNEVSYDDIIKFNYIACSTVVFNQETLGKHYMPNIRNRQDWALWIILIKKNKNAVNINDYLMYYMIRTGSISNNRLKMVKYHWYIYKSFLHFSSIKSFLYLSRNILMHIKNKRK